MTCLASIRSDILEDEGREFIITYYKEDRTITVREPPRKNSGVVGGTFLSRMKVLLMYTFHFPRRSLSTHVSRQRLCTNPVTWIYLHGVTCYLMSNPSILRGGRLEGGEAATFKVIPPDQQTNAGAGRNRQRDHRGVLLRRRRVDDKQTPLSHHRSGRQDLPSHGRKVGQRLCLL